MPTEQDFLEPTCRSSFNRLKTIAYSRVRNMPLVEELVQETFIVSLGEL